MKLALMQPYIFPYIGYFQLLNAVDKFVIYDDVNYIKGGWINRNNILINKQANLFTISLQKPSPYKLINEIEISTIRKWKHKFLRTIEIAYKKAPFYEPVYALIASVINSDSTHITEMTRDSILAVAKYLGIDTEIVPSSTIYQNQHLSGKERVLDICKKEKASVYINPIGGTKLYQKDWFKEQQIDLYFIKTLPLEYQQFKGDFVPHLSIIDVLMFNSPAAVQDLLQQYELV